MVTEQPSGLLGVTPSSTFDEVWEMPNAVVDTKVDIYDRAGENLAGTFDATKIIKLHTTKQLFSSNEPSVGNTISGEIDMEFYPVTDWGEDVTVNPAYTQDLSDGALSDLTIVNGILQLED